MRTTHQLTGRKEKTWKANALHFTAKSSSLKMHSMLIAFASYINYKVVSLRLYLYAYDIIDDFTHI